MILHDKIIMKECDMLKRIRCFISYSHKDKKMFERFKVHLNGLSRIINIQTWDDIAIKAGDEIDFEIIKRLKTYDLIFLLLSPDYINSSYCYEKEFSVAIQRHNDGTCLVIPVILKSIAKFSEHKFSKIKCIPDNATPITKYRPQNDGYKQAAEEIFDAITKRFGSNNKDTKPKKTKSQVKNSYKFEIIKNGSPKKIELTQSLFGMIPSYKYNQAEFIKYLNYALLSSVDSFKSCYNNNKNKKQYKKWHNEQLKSYLLQIITYMNSVFSGHIIAIHFRWLKNNNYTSYLCSGYEEKRRLSKRNLPDNDPMIQTAISYSLPVIKSYNKKLHKENHPTESSNERDYITCVFPKIKEKYNQSVSLCISFEGSNSESVSNTILLMVMLSIDKIIENYILSYFDYCNKIDKRYTVDKLGE